MAAGLHLLQSQQVLIVSFESVPEANIQNTQQAQWRPQDISTVRRTNQTQHIHILREQGKDAHKSLDSPLVYVGAHNVYYVKYDNFVPKWLLYLPTRLAAPK